MAVDKSINVAVVGCGQWGVKIVSAFSRLGFLAAVSDSDTEQVDKIARAYNVPALDWKSVLDDHSITAVALVTPAKYHVKMIEEAINAGKHVYVEKPLAISVSEAEAVVELVNQSGKTLLVGHILQYHPAFLALKSLMQQGKLGQVRFVRSTRFGPTRVRQDEDALWDLAPHDISMVLNLVGQQPESVRADGSYFLRPDIADSVTSRLTFPNGMEAEVAVSWAHPYKDRNLVVIGDEGTLVFDDDQPWDGKLKVFKNTLSWEKGYPDLIQGQSETVSVEEKEPLLEQLNHFAECIRTGRRPLTDVHEGLSVVKVLEAATQVMVGQRGSTENGSIKNGHTKNGVTKNGTLQNGHIENGATKNGLNTNGHSKNGVTKNGHIENELNGNGHNENGVTKNVSDENGSLKNGHSENGVTKNGSNENGSATNGYVRPEPTEFLVAQIPMIDLKIQQKRLRANIDKRIAQVLHKGQYVWGPEVYELEQKLAEYTGCTDAITCSSGTDALILAFLALDLRPGDAVLVPDFTFVGTVEPIVILGATPIFVDVDPVTLCMNPDLIAKGVEAAKKAGCRPVGLITVDIFGRPAEYDRIRPLASEFGLWLLDDGAQSFGASYGGQRVGTLGCITTTSFFPAKPLGCYGDGGAVFTSDPDLAAKVRSIHEHGKGGHRYDHVRLGMNSRLDTIQAAILLDKLEVFPEELESRQRIAARYASLLKDVVQVPLTPKKNTISAWATYTIRLKNRDGLFEYLESLGIKSSVHYPNPLHVLLPYQHYPSIEGGCPVAEQAVKEVLSLPFHPYLDEESQDKVVSAIRHFVEADKLTQ